MSINQQRLEQMRSRPTQEGGRVASCCKIAREKLRAGDFESGCAALSPWWRVGEWPNQQGLSLAGAAELLLTTGTLTDAVARAQQLPGGQRIAEALINGSIALFDHLGDRTSAIEARIELGCCHY